MSLIKNESVQANQIGGKLFQFTISWGGQPLAIEDSEATIIPAWSAVKDAIEYAYKNFYAGEYYADVFVTKVQLIYTFDGLKEAWKKDKPKRLVPARLVQINNKNEIEFRSKSFLRNQVRSMVGCLKYLAEKKWNINKFENVLKSKKRKNCAPPAPACGLYLEKVIY